MNWEAIKDSKCPKCESKLEKSFFGKKEICSEKTCNYEIGAKFRYDLERIYKISDFIHERIVRNEMDHDVNIIGVDFKAGVLCSLGLNIKGFYDGHYIKATSNGGIIKGKEETTKVSASLFQSLVEQMLSKEATKLDEIIISFGNPTLIA